MNSAVMFFLGTGGVGKSTISALKAIELAMADKKVLIATFDPSPRLKDILITKKKFSNPLLEKNLEVQILDSKKIFEDLLTKTDTETSENIKQNKLFKHLIERIQGVHEFSSLYFLSQNVHTKKYDYIIIDTPPLQNSLDFFAAPQKLKDLFESTIVKLFIGDFNKNWFEKIFKKTRDIAFATLKKLTGHDFFEQLISFMKALEKLQPIVLQTLESSQTILKHKNTKYVFVSSYEEQNLATVEKQLDLLKTENIKVNELIINKYDEASSDAVDLLMDKSEEKHLENLKEYLKYKKENFRKLKQHLDMLKKGSFTITVLPQFKTSEINEDELMIRAKEFYELDS